MNTKVVGIGGISRSGKSSLCKRLSTSLYNTIHINQDRYYLGCKTYKDPVYGKITHCEFPEAYDLKKLYDDVLNLRKALERMPCGPFTVIVEGFMIYSNDQLPALFDKCIMLNIPLEVATERRINTKPVSHDRAFSEYFEKNYIWEGFHTHNKFLPQGSLSINGTENPDTVYNIAVKYIST